MHDMVCWRDRFAAQGRLRSEVEFLIDIVFDERHGVPCQQVDQRPLAFRADQATGWIAEVEHEQAGLDRVLLQGSRQGLQIDPFARM